MLYSFTATLYVLLRLYSETCLFPEQKLLLLLLSSSAFINIINLQFLSFDIKMLFNDMIIMTKWQKYGHSWIIKSLFITYLSREPYSRYGVIDQN